MNLFNSSPKDLTFQNSAPLALDTMVKTLAHISYTLDNSNKQLVKLNHMLNKVLLQSQVDDFYETSHQTESDEQ